MDREITIDSRTVQLTSLDRVIFPQAVLTKQDVIDYYHRMAPYMIPHMKGRPLTMHRFPQGIDEQGFYQKEAPDYFPSWIRRVDIKVEEDDTVQPQITCDEPATLVYLANQSCVTSHIWLSTVEKLHYPDKLIFDLDPPSNDFDLVRRAAQDLHVLLQALDLAPFVMTTGSKGLHIVVPLQPTATFDRVREFARDVAELLAEHDSEHYTTEIRKKKREGRLFLDYLRNAYAQNSVAPYALRAKPGAPVATPLDWRELSDVDLHSQRYHIKNIFRRLGQKDDPWSDIRQHAASIETARESLSAQRGDFTL